MNIIALFSCYYLFIFFFENSVRHFIQIVSHTIIITWFDISQRQFECRISYLIQIESFSYDLNEML